MIRGPLLLLLIDGEGNVLVEIGLNGWLYLWQGVLDLHTKVKILIWQYVLSLICCKVPSVGWGLYQSQLLGHIDPLLDEEYQD